jgi:NAD-dependent deacetylase
MKDYPGEIPLCECGGVLKPDVVLYEEGLDQKIMQDSVYHISHADTMIIGGTSLAVYPAAGLIDYFRGSNLVVINKSPTPRDKSADLLISDSIGAVLGAIQC